MRKAKPAPDFTKLHQTWETKLKKGKAIAKKPLTQIQAFDLSNPTTLTYKLKQKLDFDKTGQDSLLDENFESSPSAKERILNGGAASSKKNGGRRETTCSRTAGDTPAQNTRSKSLYVSSQNAGNRPTSVTKKSNGWTSSGTRSGKENKTTNSRSRIGKQSMPIDQERDLHVNSATGFEKIEVVFKPDPEALKSIFIDPDSSPYKQCQAPFQRSTFGGKMKSNFNRPVTGNRFSIYARTNARANDMTFKEYLEHLRRESLAARERRASIHQNVLQIKNNLCNGNATFFDSQKTVASSGVASLPSSTNPGSVGLPKPNIPLPKFNTLVGFQGSTHWSGSASASSVIKQPTLSHRASQQSSTRVCQITALEPIEERLNAGKDVILRPPAPKPQSRVFLEASEPRTSKGKEREFPADPRVATLFTQCQTDTNHESGKRNNLLQGSALKQRNDVCNDGTPRDALLEMQQTKSLLKNSRGNLSSQIKRNVHWSDILASEEQQGDPISDHGKSTVIPQARKELHFLGKVTPATGAFERGLSVASQAKCVAKGTPLRNEPQLPIIDLRTPITAEEIRRRGIDPFSFNAKSLFASHDFISDAVEPSSSKEVPDAEDLKESSITSQFTSCPELSLMECGMNSKSKKDVDNISSADRTFLDVRDITNVTAIPLCDQRDDINKSTGWNKGLSVEYVNSDVAVKDTAKPSILSLGVGGCFSEEFLQELYGRKNVSRDVEGQKKLDSGLAIQRSTNYQPQYNRTKEEAIDVIVNGISSLDVKVSRDTPPIITSCDVSFVTPEKSFASFLELDNVHGGPNPLRRKARTPHSKQPSQTERHEDYHVQTVKQAQLSQTLLAGIETNASASPQDSMQSSNRDAALQDINSFHSDVQNPFANVDLLCRPLKTSSSSVREVVPCHGSSDGSFVAVGSAVWTKVLQASKTEETQTNNSVLPHVNVSSPMSSMLDHEVSLISQKIDARRKAHQFTPIRVTFTNPLLKEIANTGSEK